MYSMTGFGRGIAENEGVRVSLEIKSLNHRYCDFNIKMPHQLNPYEDVIKNSIKSHCKRGRFDVYIQLTMLAESEYAISPNFGVLDQYVKVFDEICVRYELNERPRAMSLLNLKDSLTIETAEINSELLHDALQKALQIALAGLVEMRRLEGEKLMADIVEQIGIMEDTVTSVGERAPQISQDYHAGLKRRLNELLANTSIDESRILTEAAIFADRTDISEELVRLKTHIGQLRAMLSEDEPKGRRMDFLVQEMNREINTIGSKSPDVDISQYVVVLKSQAEKIREQVQNIE